MTAGSAAFPLKGIPQVLSQLPQIPEEPQEIYCAVDIPGAFSVIHFSLCEWKPLSPPEEGSHAENSRIPLSNSLRACSSVG
jgi:hypothetical protein